MNEYKIISTGRLVLVVVFSCSFLMSAAQETGYDGKADVVEAASSSDSSEQSKGFVPLPLLYYTPDTRMAFGAVGVYYFKMGASSGRNDTRLSYTQLLADYTLNRQFDVWGLWNIFFTDEKYLSKGEFRYRIYNDRFYGIGNNTPDWAMEKYKYEYFTIKKLLLKKLRKGMFFGGGFSAYSLL